MIRNAFAMLPSAWVRPPRLGIKPEPGFVPLEDTEGILVKGGLKMLQWRQHKGAATAALLIPFALAVISNRSQRRNGLRQDNTVAATYEQIQTMVPLSRKLIADGLQLLLMVEAIDAARDGRRNVYTLRGIERNGGWCALPQSHLHNAHSHLHRSCSSIRSAALSRCMR